jgi:sn-glycerol 3-phosphate transport system substrate-binding protein
VWATVAAMLCASPAFSQTEIAWWHAMSGELQPIVEKLAADFNASQKDYRVVPEFKGQYTQTMTAALFAMRSTQHPAIVQVNEVATATMMAAKGATYPVYQLMREQGVAFDPKAYLPAVAGYYTDPAGNMLSFPFNASTPILYYNKDQFRLAKIDAETPPRTWPEVEAAAKKLLAAGVPCGFSAAWPSWVHVENLSAVHDVPIATKQNGFAGPRSRTGKRAKSSITAGEGIAPMPGSTAASAACTSPHRHRGRTFWPAPSSRSVMG